MEGALGRRRELEDSRVPRWWRALGREKEGACRVWGPWMVEGFLNGGGLGLEGAETLEGKRGTLQNRGPSPEDRLGSPEG